MAIGFPLVVGEAVHSVLINSRPVEPGEGGIWFSGHPAERLFPSAYQPTFSRLRSGIRLELLVNVVDASDEKPLFAGRGAVAALLLASHFDCARLTGVLLSAVCDLPKPGDSASLEIIPLGRQSFASVRARALGLGYSLLMHEDDLTGMTSLALEDWEPESPLPQLVRIPKGMLLNELANVFKVRSFSEIASAHS